MRKNLLIGAITNYTWDDIAPFFNSFIKAKFENCECVMFVGNMSERTINKMKSCGVDVRPIPEKFLNGRIVLYRFELFYEFVKENLNKYSMIMTADVRDVIFQRDLFSLLDSSEHFLGLAVEDGPLLPKFNKEWIEDIYGHEVCNAIKDKNTICMGTVWGTSKEFCDFVGALDYELKHGPKPYDEMNDQGSANVMISYRKMFSDVIMTSTNYDGYVMTIGLTPKENIQQDSSGNILNSKGEIVAVIHQYDRKPEFIKRAYSIYGQGVLFSPLTMKKHAGTFTGRIIKFLQKSHWNGLMKTLSYAVKKICK